MTFCIVIKCDGRATIVMTADLDESFDEVARCEVVGQGIEF